MIAHDTMRSVDRGQDPGLSAAGMRPGMAIAPSAESIGCASAMRNGPVAVALGRFGEVTARGLRQILSEDDSIRLVGADLEPAALREAVARYASAVAIVDESLVAAGDLARDLRRAHAGLALIVLATSPTRDYGMRLLASGVAGCLRKDASAVDLSRAIRLVAAGHIVLGDSPGEPISTTSPADTWRLTQRERDVYECLRSGQKNAAIAQQLGISEQTVKSHAASIYRKLNVRRRDLLHVAPLS